MIVCIVYIYLFDLFSLNSQFLEVEKTSQRNNLIWLYIYIYFSIKICLDSGFFSLLK